MRGESLFYPFRYPEVTRDPGWCRGILKMNTESSSAHAQDDGARMTPQKAAPASRKLRGVQASDVGDVTRVLTVLYRYAT